MKIAALSAFLALCSALPAVGQANPHLEKGVALLKQGNAEAAAQELTEAAKNDPDSYPTFVNLGIARVRLKRWAEAEQAFRKAVELRPAAAGGHYNLALVLLQQGKTEAALEELRTSVKLAPGSADAHYNLGTLLLERNPEEALPHLEKALALAPRSETILQLTRAQIAAKRFDAALRTLGFLSERYRDSPQALFLAVRAFVGKGEFEKAFNLLEEARLAGQESPALLLYQARLYQRVGNPEAALPLLQKAAELDPSSAEIPYSAGFSYYVLEKYNEAAAELSKALEKNDKLDRAYLLQAIVKLSAGHSDEAVELLRTAIDLRPGNPYYRCFYGMALVPENRLAEARASLQQAVELDANYALARYQLGRVLVREQNYSGALPQLEKALELKPDLHEALYHLGQVYRRVGRPHDASRVLKQFEQAQVELRTDRQELLQAVQESLGGVKE